MKVKIITVNKEGKLQITKDELQSLLNEAYWEGYSAGKDAMTIPSLTYPSYTPFVWNSDHTTITCSNAVDNKANVTFREEATNEI